MMKWTVQAFAVVVLCHDRVSSFHAPALVDRRARRAIMPLRMVTEQRKHQEGSHNSSVNHVSGWISSSLEIDKVDAATVSRQVIEIGEQAVHVDDPVVNAPGFSQKKHATTMANTVKDGTKTTAKTNKRDNEKWDWITGDMTKAGQAERESGDWVADDMIKAGKEGVPVIGGNNEWIANDMKEAGQIGQGHTPSSKQPSSKKKKTREDKIADSMKQAGEAGLADWVEKDMEVAGRADDATAKPFFDDKLGKALNRKHEKDYDDIYDDVAKAGKQGSELNSVIKKEMENTGRAEYFTEKIAASTKNESYKFRAEKSAYDGDWIRKDMQDAGHAQSSDAATADVAFFGRDRSLGGNPAGSQDPEITERLSSNHLKDAIAHDLAKAGSAVPAGTHRKGIPSTKELNVMIADDMIKAGKDSGTDWIARDMENVGHGESSLNKKSVTAKNPSHQQQGTARDDTTLPVADIIVEGDLLEPRDEGELVIGDPVAEEHHEHASLPIRVMKKAVMPWKKWDDI